MSQGFKGWATAEEKAEFIGNLLDGLTKWNVRETAERKNVDKFTEQGFFITSIMDSNINPELQDRIRQNNEEFVERQMKKIDEGLNLIKSGNLGNPYVQKNIKTNQRPIAFKWCQEYLGESYCNLGIKIDTKKIPGLSKEKAIIVGSLPVPAGLEEKAGIPSKKSFIPINKK